MWKYFVLGMLVGWLGHWIIDRLLRQRAVVLSAAVGKEAPVSNDRPTSRDASSGNGTPRADASEPGRPRVESNTGTSTSAGTSAGRVGSEAALGAEGAVSTSSATLSSTAPVYRQSDLAAIEGIDPRTGARLREQGITTFSELAVAPLEELSRIAEEAGRPLPAEGVAAWRAQARLAAAGDWAALARAKAGAA
jgi:predicted flap endonuclease-1-like 5' DNA nuclease